MAIESPSYKVLKHDGKFELRQYSGYITANVRVESANHNDAGNRAFGYLADYIFGNNTVKGSIAMTAPVTTQKETSEKIAMTVPVDTKKISTDNYVVSFTMPSSYTMKSLPRPNNSNVSLKETGPYKAAALKFGGYTSENKVQEKIAELKRWCKLQKLSTVGNAVVSRYDAPWKPGFMRHNEISFRVK